MIDEKKRETTETGYSEIDIDWGYDLIGRDAYKEMGDVDSVSK